MSWLLGFMLLSAAVLYVAFDQLPQKALKKLSLERHFEVENCYVDDTITMKLALNNGSRLPLSWLLIEGEIPAEVTVEGCKNESDKRLAFRLMTQIKGRSTLNYAYDCTFHKRGYYLFYNLNYTASDYMGLRKNTGLFRDKAIMYVYPSIKEKNELVDFNRRLMGEKEVKNQLVADPLMTMGSRDYTSNDPMNHIHWNATARAGTLQVRKFAQSTEMSTMVIFNAKTKESAFEGVDNVLFEQLVSVTAAYVADFEKTHQPYGLVSNCPIQEGQAGVMIPCGKGRKHYHKVFRALSLVNHYTFCSPETILQFAFKHSPKTTRLLLITGTIDDALASAMKMASHKGFQIEVVCPMEVMRANSEKLGKVRFYPLKEGKDE